MQFHVGIIYLSLIGLSYSLGQNITVQQPVWNRLLSRRQRFIVFPKGVTLKFTAFLTKGFLATYPRGMAFVIEMAFYYPGPGKITDLVPKRLRPSTTSASKPIKPIQPLACIPGTTICYKTKPINRIDLNTNHLIQIDQNKYNNFSNIWSKYQKYSDSNYYQNKYNWTPAKLNTQHSNWQKWNTYGEHNSHHLKHVATHRERKSLFKNFEGLRKILGFDVKTCILRSICDAKQFLLPKGYSLIHDILRILFNFPTSPIMNDEYTEVMRATFETCNMELQYNCPINLLHWLTNSYVIN